MKIPSIVSAAIALTAAVPAAAQMVSAGNPDSVVKALQAEGFQAKLGKDAEGDPKITSASSGSSYDIYFYGCEANKSCTSIQFASGYNTPDGKGPSPARINEWNSKKRLAAASLDDEADPWLRMDVFMSAAGISTQVFRDNVEMWNSQMAEFEKQIGWND